MIHLDHASTSLPRSRAATTAAREAFDLPTPGRGRYQAQLRSTEIVERARAAVQSALAFETVCFGSSATHALSQAIVGLRPVPRRVAIDPLCHNAVRRPVHALGVPTWVLPADRDGRVDVSAAQDAWVPQTDLAVLTHGSNVNGVLQPVAELAHLAKRQGAFVVVDAAQTAGTVRAEFDDVDALAFSGHKALASLPGVGVLAIRDAARMEPLVLGGTGFDAAPATMPRELPARLEAGTPNLPGIAALGAAAASAATWDWRTMNDQLQAALAAAGITVNSIGDLPVASFSVHGSTPTEVEEVLDRGYEIQVRAGVHCAVSAHAHLRTAESGTVRVSCGRTTTAAELERLTRALRELVTSG